ncbi:ECF transporter S component [Falsibacillus albus]|uniref:Riboflavin transporter n=1 Tax=Falsibacillus albus TaxID=2478915 RepID=A0A3L7JW16_9BACI|nr:ECF transporter S component [Falsibacillus albus]RLQ95058.1 ECF transporter S component [Falsibacillus albus]
MKKRGVLYLVGVAMLSSIAYILMMLNFPLPPFPTFLKIDFSDIPALIAAIIMGPAAGILVEFIKNLLHYIMTGSDGFGVPVGDFANFMAGILYILPTYYIYNRLKTRKSMTFGLVLGTATMAVMMSVLNYFVILPAYTYFLHAPAMSGAEVRAMIVTAILPFNFVKGFITMLLFMLLFSRMQNWMNKQAYKNA